MTFEEVLVMVKRAYERVFWTGSSDSREHADTILKCATRIYIEEKNK